VIEQSLGYVDEPEDRVVDDFPFVGHVLKICSKGNAFLGDGKTDCFISRYWQSEKSVAGFCPFPLYFPYTWTYLP
uniref:hypothetical protein n=1 Tax=Prevotella heparinolytica TaxID=28113 RepID=UPI00359F620B